MELIQHLVSELGITARQAEGGAGLLLGLAQNRLSRDEFVRVADCVPAISDVIGKAPRTNATASRSLRQTVSRWLGGLGGLLAVVEGFNKLGCDRAMINSFADTLVECFRTKGGEDVATLLQGALH